jgi:hypothetical protein
MGKTAVDVTSRGDAILSKYLGSTNPMDVDAKLGESLINAYKNQTALKNSLYKGAEEIADTIGMPVEISNFNKSLLQNKGILENVKLDAPTQKLLEKALAPPSLTAQMSGQTNASNLSLKEANILAGALKGLSNQYNSPLPADRFIAGSLSKLGSSLKTDIKQSIDKTGNPLLKEAYTGAEQNYKETFSKFLDKDIYKFLSGKKSAEDLVSTFIKTGRNTDKSGQLGKLMTKLDPEGQNLLKYSYLSRAIKGGEDDRYLDPNALKNLWSQNNLGIKQKAALIPDKAERSALNDYSKLVGMNSEALGRMFNPKTGQRGLENLGNIVDVGLGVGGMSAGGLPGALAALVAKPLTARSLTNKLTSQAYREKLVEKMLKKDKSMSAGSILPAAITTGLTQSIQNALNERR